MPKPLNLGRIAYGLMGRAHSNAYCKGNHFFNLEFRPVVKAACARRLDKARACAGEPGGHEADRRRQAWQLPPLSGQVSAGLVFYNDPATTEIYALSLHDALPIYPDASLTLRGGRCVVPVRNPGRAKIDGIIHD